jgi:hypothetical protein
MKSKTLAIAVICIIILASVPVSSVFSSKIEKSHALISSNKDEIQASYERMLDKVHNGSDPSKEISELLSYHEIKDAVRDFSDDETLETIEILFSEKNRFIKRQKIIQYHDKIESERQSSTIQELEYELNNILSSNIGSLENIENLEFISKLNLTLEDITNYYVEWVKYLDENPRLELLILDFDIDPLDIFVFLICVWSFIYAGAAVAFPCVVMIVEATIFGMLAGTATGIFMTYLGDLGSSEEHMVLEWFARIIAGSNLSLYFPNFVDFINSTLLDTIPAFLSLLGTPLIKHAAISLMAIVIFCSYCVAFNHLDFVQFFGGGAGLVAGEILIYLFVFYLLPEEGISLDATD